jgi:hypothetical protein
MNDSHLAKPLELEELLHCTQLCGGHRISTRIILESESQSANLQRLSIYK